MKKRFFADISGRFIMAKQIVIFSFLFCLVLTTAAAQTRETAKSHIEQGQAHMRNRNYAEAIISFEAAKRLDQRDRKIDGYLSEAKTERATQLFHQGQTLQGDKKYEEAIENYNLAIRTAPQGYNNLRMIQNRRDEAQRDLETQREHEFHAAEAQERSAREQAARERAEQTRQIIERANSQFIGGEYDEAITTFEHAIHLGSLNDAETADAKRLIAEAQDIKTKTEGYKRALRDTDFDVQQNRDASVTILKYKASESKTINVGGVNHTVHIGIFEVVIPSTLHGQRVTIIDNMAFANKGLTNVTIPNTITEIGVGAFSENNISRLILSSSLITIKGGAIAGRAEANEPGAFEGNKNLTDVVIPNTTTEIGSRAFKDCSITNLTLGTKVAVIGESAFRNNKITHLNLPVSVRRIYRFAFNSNLIQTLALPNGVQQIWDDAFSNNPMTALIIPASLIGLFQNQPCIGVDHEQYGPNVPSFPETVTRVTLPLNVNERNLRGFHISLQNFYASQQRRAGTYVKSESADIWSRQ